MSLDDVFSKIKDAVPSKKQVKDYVSKIGSAKIDKLDTLAATETKPAETPDGEDD